MNQVLQVIKRSLVFGWGARFLNLMHLALCLRRLTNMIYVKGSLPPGSCSASVGFKQWQDTEGWKKIRLGNLFP